MCSIYQHARDHSSIESQLLPLSPTLLQLSASMLHVAEHPQHMITYVTVSIHGSNTEHVLETHNFFISEWYFTCAEHVQVKPISDVVLLGVDQHFRVGSDGVYVCTWGERDGWWADEGW